MRNPRDMRTIQIDITNACVRSCSNCTRFCGHHKKPFYMNFETFKKAVDSLEGFEGIVGLMGGEPTLHPEFDRFAAYVGEKFGNAYKINPAKIVINDFPEYMAHRYSACTAINKAGGAGLFTSITNNFYKYFELIQQTFDLISLNDHSQSSYHQPILITRKEYGIEDEEWEKLRDACWIQNTWSASITPNGVFFCEVAASLNILFNGPGGFPIEDGWWKRDISEFKPQFHWCEMCGIALKTFDKFKRDAKEEIDDVSPYLYERLKTIGSKKLEKGQVKLFTSTKNDIKDDENRYTTTRYLDEYDNRFGDSLATLRPKSLVAINTSDIKENFGQSVYNKIKEADINDWVILFDGENAFITEDELRNKYLNPGVCFVNDGQILFNKNASSFINAGYDGFYCCNNIDDIKNLWQGSNTAYLQNEFCGETVSDEIKRWKFMMECDTLNDYNFRCLILNEIKKKGIKKGDNIILVIPATFYLGRAVYYLLNHLGYNAHIFIFKGNVCHYDDLVSKENLHAFKGNATYNFDMLKQECDELKSKIDFKGSILLVNMPYEILTEEEGYSDALKISNYMAENFVGCVNIRRKFSRFC